MKFSRIISVLVVTTIFVVASSMITASSDQSAITTTYIVYDCELDERVGGYALTLENAEYASSTYGVIGADTRVTYENSGIVRIHHSDGNIATGFVVDDHTIATAAHCVYGEYSEEFSNDFEIELFDDQGEFVTSVEPSEIHIPILYTALLDENYKYDYALIRVDADLSEYEHFELGTILDTAAYSTSIPVNVAGFPDDQDNDLYVGTGVFRQFNETNIDYTADTFSGESGGPVFITTSYRIGDGDPVVLRTAVGINTYGAGNTNFGTRITPALIKFYRNNPNNPFEEESP